MAQADSERYATTSDVPFVPSETVSLSRHFPDDARDLRFGSSSGHPEDSSDQPATVRSSPHTISPSNSAKFQFPCTFNVRVRWGHSLGGPSGHGILYQRRSVSSTATVDGVCEIADRAHEYALVQGVAIQGGKPLARH